MTTLYVLPTDEQKEVMQSFRDQYEELLIRITKELPDGRGKSLTLTKLEESAMWVNKAITEND